MIKFHITEVVNLSQAKKRKHTVWTETQRKYWATASLTSFFTSSHLPHNSLWVTRTYHKPIHSPHMLGLGFSSIQKTQFQKNIRKREKYKHKLYITLLTIPVREETHRVWNQKLFAQENEKSPHEKDDPYIFDSNTWRTVTYLCNRKAENTCFM